MNKRILIAIPARNEASTIGSVIDSIPQEYSIIVVDDYSSDGTNNAFDKKRAKIISLCTRLGAWGATQAAMRYACSKNYDYVITMDGDGQHVPESIKVLLKTLDRDDLDVVIGSCIERGSRLRKIAWKIIKYSSGIKLEDVTSGFRIYNKRAYELLASTGASMFEYQDIGVLIYLLSHNIKIGHSRVKMKERQVGISRIFSSWISVFYYMYYTLILGFSKRLNRFN